jgi:hypothetical protein
MRPVVNLLRERGMRVIVYLDDWLFINSTHEGLVHDLQFARHLFSALGLVVNLKKSQIEPTRAITFLGLIIDSRGMQFRVPAAKIAQITSQCARFASRPQLTARDLAELLGRINSVSLVCDYASLYSRNMQMCLGSEISAVPDYSRIITLDQPSTEELDWWTTNISEHAARPISLASPTFEITSDASKLGWGAVCNNVRTGGRWSQEETPCHINVLELKASFFALKIFCKDLRRITVRARLDNTTAIAYIKQARRH